MDIALTLGKWTIPDVPADWRPFGVTVYNARRRDDAGERFTVHPTHNDYRICCRDAAIHAMERLGWANAKIVIELEKLHTVEHAEACIIYTAIGDEWQYEGVDDPEDVHAVIGTLQTYSSGQCVADVTPTVRATA